MENKTIFIILSIVELVLSLLLWILHYAAFRGGGKMEFFFLSGVYGGFVFVTIGVLIMVFLGEDEDSFAILYFVICGAVVYIIAALFTFMAYTDNQYANKILNDGDKMLLKTICSGVLGAVFVFDTVFRIMNR